MSLIRVGCELQYQVTAPTSFLFHVTAANTQHQAVHHEDVRVEPAKEYDICYLGAEDNRVFRLQTMPGELTLHYQASVSLNPAVDSPPQIPEIDHPELPEEVLPYLNPSRYCESDRLATFAMAEFGRLDRGYSRVAAICQWTYDHLNYLPGITNASTGACDVLILRSGVCRDYAHLAIALCRALCIPARYVSGYAVALDPPDFHGFFEAYLGNHWYLSDATRLAPLAGLVRIGMGRDAADVPFATIIGAATLKNKVVLAQELTEEIPQEVAAVEPAVSTA
ncbi:MAG: transglutaminase-like domain-containing protein [Candidatus Binatia bacterium]